MFLRYGVVLHQGDVGVECPGDELIVGDDLVEVLVCLVVVAADPKDGVE